MDARDRLFADIALRLQLLTRDQIASCVVEVERGVDRPLSDIAVALGFITGEEAGLVKGQVERLHERQRAAQRAGGGGLRVAEEHVPRADPRAESSPVSAKAVAAAPQRKRGARTWEAPTSPEQGLIQVRPANDAAPEPPAAPIAAPSVRPAPRREMSARVDSFPMADSDAAARAAPGPAVAAAAMPAPAFEAPAAPIGSPAGTLVQPFIAPHTQQPPPASPQAQPPPRPAASEPPGAYKRPPKVPETRPAAAVAKEASYLGKALALAVRHGASDLHVHSGSPLQIRVDGQLRPLSASAPLTPEAAEHVIAEITTDGQWQRLAERGEVDFACEVPRVGRFRVNVYRQQRGLDAVFRIIPLKVPTLESLGLPSRLARLTDYRTGMVLCTGPTGCGKSSTLAALIQQLAFSRAEHILTVEDPVEFVYEEGQALINQRQVRDHTTSFARALRAALREDPDVIAITELRDRETMSLAISAAETGHLVLGTLHTGNASQTISRIVSSFDQGEQEQIRVMLSESLRAVVSQRLVPMASGRGRAPAVEILMVNHAVANLIREDKTYQLPSVMQTGKAAGMLTMDDSLAELVAAGTVTPEAARRFAVRKERFA